METVTLEFNAQQLNVIAQALQQAPYAVAAPVLNAIEKQMVAHQMKAKAEAQAAPLPLHEPE